MCHPLQLSGIDVDINLDMNNPRVHIMTSCRPTGATGVEMEALTVAAVVTGK
jgi:cyclic pyranopterin phosphate synthase